MVNIRLVLKSALHKNPLHKTYWSHYPHLARGGLSLAWRFGSFPQLTTKFFEKEDGRRVRVTPFFAGRKSSLTQEKRFRCVSDSSYTLPFNTAASASLKFILLMVLFTGPSKNIFASVRLDMPNHFFSLTLGSSSATSMCSLSSGASASLSPTGKR